MAAQPSNCKGVCTATQICNPTTGRCNIKNYSNIMKINVERAKFNLKPLDSNGKEIDPTKSLKLILEGLRYPDFKTYIEKEFTDGTINDKSYTYGGAPGHDMALLDVLLNVRVRPANQPAPQHQHQHNQHNQQFPVNMQFLTDLFDISKTNKTKTKLIIEPANVTADIIKNIDLLKLFLENGLDPNKLFMDNNYGKMNTILTMVAASPYTLNAQSLTITKLLLKHGANPDIPNTDGFGTLMYTIYASKNDHTIIVRDIRLEIVKLLVKAGADIFAKNCLNVYETIEANKTTLRPEIVDVIKKHVSKLNLGVLALGTLSVDQKLARLGNYSGARKVPKDVLTIVKKMLFSNKKKRSRSKKSKRSRKHRSKSFDF